MTITVTTPEATEITVEVAGASAGNIAAVIPTAFSTVLDPIVGTEHALTLDGTALKKVTIDAIKAFSLSGLTLAWGSITGKPSTFPPTIGSGAGDAVAGNDARLTDARTPTAHTHTSADITDATSDGFTNKDVILKTNAFGFVTLGGLSIRNSGITLSADGVNIGLLDSVVTDNRTWTLPDKDGTVAMTSDITGTNSGTNTGDEVGVVVIKADGTRTSYAPSANTDTARGLALEAAFAAAVAGDTIDLSPGNYLITKAYSGTVGGSVADFAILDKMTIRLNGARLYRTTPSTVTAGSFVIGRSYTIINPGTTNFVSEQGTANSNAGTSFVAIAAGTGTGTAILTPPVMFAVAHVNNAIGGNDWSLIGPGIVEGTAATTTTTGYTNEIGLNVNVSRRWRIDNVSFLKFRGTGLQLNSTNYTGDTSGYAVKVSTGHVSNCNFDFCNIGMGNYAGNEYTSFTNCTFNKNLTGADVSAGNTKFVGCEICENTNFGIRIRNGGNDGHGCFVGGMINHNAGFSIAAEANMDLGFTFAGSHVFGDSGTTNKIQSLGGGLNFTGCIIDAPIYASATPSGINTIAQSFFPGTYAAITDLSATERAKWKFQNNHTLTGTWASDDIRTTYADDAAAGVGGVLQGELWQQTTTGAVFVKL